MDASTQLRAEIHAAIRRLGLESEITVYQVLGVLRVIEADLIEELTRQTKQN